MGPNASLVLILPFSVRPPQPPATLLPATTYNGSIPITVTQSKDGFARIPIVGVDYVVEMKPVKNDLFYPGKIVARAY